MQTPVLRALQIALLLTPAALAVPSAQAAWEMPPLDKVLNYQPKQHLQVFTADGVEIAQFGAERRQFVPIKQIPLLLQDAVLAVEDARFRQHSGIDPKGMARAVLAMLTGGRRQGASTITQQVARTFFLTQRFTAERKAKEIMIALKMEQELSKDRILELYMNEIFLGQRAYGFAAASQTYFGKALDKLTLAETALLAGLPQNPHYANPVANMDRAIARQRIVLERMHFHKHITDAQLASARAQKILLRSSTQGPLHAEHVAEMARRVVVERFGSEAYTQGIRVVTSLRSSEQAAAWTALRKGVLDYDRKGPWRGPEAQENLPEGDGPETERAAALALKDHRDDEQLRVAIVLKASPREVLAQLASGERISLSGEGLRWAQPALAPKARAPLALQRGAVLRVVALPAPVQAAAKGLPKAANSAQAAGKAATAPVQSASAAAPITWAISQWPQVQSAFVALDPPTGRIRALVGGFDFTQQPFNHVTQAWRQPGSSFKPILYSAALEQGVMPATLVDDLPFVGANGWAPQNSDGRFDGPLTMRTALARSKNLVSVRLAQFLGVTPVRNWAANFGLDLARQPDNLTLALGAGSATPLQMAQAYATFANGGWKLNPVLVERITDANGKLLFEAPPAAPLSEETRAIPARNVFISASLLNDVTRSGTAARAQSQLRRSDLYGKTGTTNDAVDAWFAGYQPGLAAVAWMGFDEPRSLGERESGGGLALPIWLDFMASALKGVPVAAPRPVPPGVLREGDDWLYSEWATGGWVSHISTELGVVRAGPPVPPAPPASAPSSPAGAPESAATILGGGVSAVPR